MLQKTLAELKLAGKNTAPESAYLLEGSWSQEEREY